MVYTRWSSGLESTRYVTTDHLNSSTVVMDSAGAILVNLSFAAFGARRGSAWTGTPSSGDWTQINNSTRQGYTGHEHLDNVNIVHMNGRVYDPALGRFLSADPFMPGALGSQASNRYAYVGNRPLSAIDPSGYFPRNGNALKQWMDGPGQLDALELAQHRGWLSWGGVRNVSDGLEGTHVGLFEFAMQTFIDNQAAGQQSNQATLWAIAASGYRTPQQSMGSFANANRANANRTASAADSSCDGCLPAVTVTASRTSGQESIAWTPGRLGTNGPGFGWLGGVATGLLNSIVSTANAAGTRGDPFGEPFIPDQLLPALARPVLAGNRFLDENGQVGFSFPADWGPIPLPHGGGFVFAPLGWQPELGLRSVIRVQPAGTGSWSRNPGGYYVVYNAVGDIISPYSGRYVPPSRSHNPLRPFVPFAPPGW